MESAIIYGLYVCRYVWFYVLFTLALEDIEIHRIIQACWDKGFFVVQLPMGRGWSKKPFPVKLQMDMQGQLKTGDQIYEQNSEELRKKINEMYIYMFKKFVY